MTTLRTLLALVLLLAAHARLRHVVGDRRSTARTGQVIIASATCVRQAGLSAAQAATASRDLMDVQAVIVPGVGVAACQAGADNTRENQMLVYNELKKGTPPTQILELLKKQEAARKPETDGAPAVRHPRDSQRQARSPAQNNRAGFNGTGNSDRRSTSAARSATMYLPGAGQHAARRRRRAQGRAGVHPRQRARWPIT